MFELTFEGFDGRSHEWRDVINVRTGEKVGSIRTKTGFGIEVKLFDGKYFATLANYEQCVTFVRGVSSVLNRLVSIDDGRSKLEAKLHNLENPPEKRRFGFAKPAQKDEPTT